MMLQFIFILFDFFLLAYATFRCLRLVLIEEEREREKERERKKLTENRSYFFSFSYLFESNLLPVVCIQLPFPAIPLELSILSPSQEKSGSKRKIFSQKFLSIAKNSNKILWITKLDHVAHAEDFLLNNF